MSFRACPKSFAAAAGPLKKFDKLDVESDSISAQKGKKIVIFSGNVKARQQNNNLKFYSDNLRIKYDIDDGNKMFIRNMSAAGNVKVIREDVTIRGNFGFYDLLKNTITMEDNVTLYEKTGKARGDAVIYDLEKNNAEIYGKKNGGQEEKAERVEIILEDADNFMEKYGK
ncbi:MAG: LptA/OstA family protein [Rickettsiales bacterium]|nr:LptA/OstA family protein [Rickettsiales bacterium]